MNNFYFDSKLEDGTIIYTSKDNEDDFIELISPINSKGNIIVEYYKLCSRVRTELYNNISEIVEEFNIDKNKGNEFFFEQTNMDENTFNSSAFSNSSLIISSTILSNFVHRFP